MNLPPYKEWLGGWNCFRLYWFYSNCRVITKASDHVGVFFNDSTTPLSLLVCTSPFFYTIKYTCLCLLQAGIPYSDTDPGGTQGGGGQCRSGRLYGILQERPPLTVLRRRGECVVDFPRVCSDMWGEKYIKDPTKIAFLTKGQHKVTQPACLYASFNCGTPQCWACFIKVPY